MLRLLAYSNNGNGLASKLITVSTLETEPSSPPTNMTAYPLSHDALVVEWIGVHRHHINGVPLGYKLHYVDDSIPKLVTVPYNESKGYLYGLYAATTYIVSVCAFNKAGEGPCEVTEGKTFESAPTYPPSVLRILSKNHDMLTIGWNEIIPTAEPLNNYGIQYFAEETGGIPYVNPTKKMFLVSLNVLTVSLRMLQSNTRYMIKVFGVNQYGYGVPTAFHATTCKCPEYISSNYYLKAPYVTRQDPFKTGKLDGIFPQILSQLVTSICGQCASSPGTTVDFSTNGKSGFAGKENIDRVVEDIDEYTQLSFPLSMNPAANKTDRSAFITLVKYPGALYVVKDVDITDLVKKTLNDLIKLWPLLFVNFLFTIISGGIIWWLETNCSKKGSDFSRKPKYGFTEGWYYAYVTQVTLGYGDFVPKTFIARLFCVLWMVIGLIKQALLLSSMITVINVAHAPQSKFIYGKTVAAISGSFEERLVYLRNGEVPTGHVFSTIMQLLDALDNGEVAGVLIDAYTMGDNLHILNNSQYYRIAAYIEYPRSLGIVVTGAMANIESEILGYLKTNEQNLVDLVDKFTEKLKPGPEPDAFSILDSDTGFLKKSVTVLLPLLLILILIGLLYGWLTKKRRNKAVQPEISVSESLQEAFDDLRKDVVSFQCTFKKKITTLGERFDQERVLLSTDRGESSLDPVPKYKVYKRPACITQLLLSGDYLTFTTDNLQNPLYPGHETLACSQDDDLLLSTITRYLQKPTTSRRSSSHSDAALEEGTYTAAVDTLSRIYTGADDQLSRNFKIECSGELKI